MTERFATGTWTRWPLSLDESELVQAIGPEAEVVSSLSESVQSVGLSVTELRMRNFG